MSHQLNIIFLKHNLVNFTSIQNLKTVFGELIFKNNFYALNFTSPPQNKFCGLNFASVLISLVLTGIIMYFITFPEVYVHSTSLAKQLRRRYESLDFFRKIIFFIDGSELTEEDNLDIKSEEEWECCCSCTKFKKSISRLKCHCESLICCLKCFCTSFKKILMICFGSTDLKGIPKSVFSSNFFDFVVIVISTLIIALSVMIESIVCENDAVWFFLIPWSVMVLILILKPLIYIFSDCIHCCCCVKPKPQETKLGIEQIPNEETRLTNNQDEKRKIETKMSEEEIQKVLHKGVIPSPKSSLEIRVEDKNETEKTHETSSEKTESMDIKDENNQSSSNDIESRIENETIGNADLMTNNDIENRQSNDAITEEDEKK